MRRSVLSKFTVVVAVAAFGVAGCGDDDSGSSADGGGGSDTGKAGDSGGYGGGQSAGGGGGGATLNLAADSGGALKFDKSALSAKAGKVTIDFDNPSSASAPHAVEIEGNGVEEESETIQPGEKSSVSAELEPGTYEFYCPVGNHKQAGMEGTLTVK